MSALFTYTLLTAPTVAAMPALAAAALVLAVVCAAAAAAQRARALPNLANTRRFSSSIPRCALTSGNRGIAALERSGAPLVGAPADALADAPADAIARVSLAPPALATVSASVKSSRTEGLALVLTTAIRYCPFG